MTIVQLPSSLTRHESARMTYDESHRKFWIALNEPVALWCREHVHGGCDLRPKIILTHDDPYFPMQTDDEDGVSEVQGTMIEVVGELVFGNDADALLFKMKWL